MKLCIYHGGCTDGVAAAWALWKAHPDATFWPGVYQTDPPWSLVEQAHEIYLVDFSYKHAVMQEIAQRSNRKPVVLDHHDTAKNDLTPLLADGTVGGDFDLDRCGALITWDFFHGNPRPPLLERIDISDRRAEGYNDYVKGLILAVRTRPHAPALRDAEGWHELFNHWSWLMEPMNLPQLEKEGETLLSYYNARVEEHVQAACMWTMDVHVLPMVNAPYYLASDVAGELAKNSPSQIGAVYWIGADGSVTFSLRSTKDGPHVGSFCESFAGGGGHPHAAGFKVNAVCVDPVEHVVKP